MLLTRQPARQAAAMPSPVAVSGGGHRDRPCTAGTSTMRRDNLDPSVSLVEGVGARAAALRGRRPNCQHARLAQDQVGQRGSRTRTLGASRTQSIRVCWTAAPVASAAYDATVAVWPPSRIEVQLAVMQRELGARRSRAIASGACSTIEADRSRVARPAPATKGVPAHGPRSCRPRPARLRCRPAPSRWSHRRWCAWSGSRTCRWRGSNSAVLRLARPLPTMTTSKRRVRAVDWGGWCSWQSAQTGV